MLFIYNSFNKQQLLCDDILAFHQILSCCVIMLGHVKLHDLGQFHYLNISEYFIEKKCLIFDTVFY